MVFVNQMLAHVGEEGCLDAVERGVPINVASAGASPDALHRELGEEAVARARVACKMLVNQISYSTILKLILAAGSHEGWSILNKFYAPQAAAPTRQGSLNRRTAFEKRTRNPPNECFARGRVLKSWLALHGVTFSDMEANQHFAHNIFHAFGVQKESVLLSNPDLTCKVLVTSPKCLRGDGDGERGGE